MYIIIAEKCGGEKEEETVHCRKINKVMPHAKYNQYKYKLFS